MSAATSGWVHLTHPDIGGEQLVPDSADVLEALAARGWVVSDAIPPELDADHQGEPEPAAPVEAPADDPAPGPVDNDDPAPADDNEGVIERG